MDKEILFGWIKVDDQQLQWLINYLSSRIPTSIYTQLPYSPVTIEEIVRDICIAKTNDSLVLFMTKTKAAWNQFQRRIHRKKSYVTATLEIKKDVYNKAVEIAKKYKIPTNIAIEELIKKGCEHEAVHLVNEKSKKRITSIKLDISKKLDTHLSNLSTNDRVPHSLESIRNKLTIEMLERYILKVKLIELTTEKDIEARENQLSKEKERYIRDCEEFGVDCSE